MTIKELNSNSYQKFELDDQDWKIINARLAEAKAGGIASQREVKRIFDKYRIVVRASDGQLNP